MGKLPVATVKTTASFLQSIDNSQNREIIESLIKILNQYDSSLTVKPAWLGLGWKKHKNYLCNATPYKDHVKIMIMRGVLLSDPQNKLEGVGINTRHIKYYSSADIDAQYLRTLLDQQAELYASGMKWKG